MVESHRLIEEVYPLLNFLYQFRFFILFALLNQVLKVESGLHQSDGFKNDPGHAPDQLSFLSRVPSY